MPRKPASARPTRPERFHDGQLVVSLRYPRYGQMRIQGWDSLNGTWVVRFPGDSCGLAWPYGPEDLVSAHRFPKRTPHRQRAA